MTTARLRVALDIICVVLVLCLAVILRADWSYRTANADEAMNLFGGWQLLQGQDTHSMGFYMGWPYLGMLPLGLADSIGGLQAARALNTFWGVLTVLFIVLVGRRLYGRLAGCVAGGIFAVFAPAIHISTFATNHSLAIFLASVALYLWVVAVLDDVAGLALLGGLAMVAAVLAHYVALVVALPALVCASVWTGVGTTSLAGGDRNGIPSSPPRPTLWRIALLWLPFVVLPAYVLVYQSDLALLWQARTASNDSPAPGVAWEILTQLRNYLWLPTLTALLALDWRGRRLFAAGFLLTSVCLVAYQLWSRDTGTLVPNSCYILLGLAPLVGGGLAAWTRGWGGQRTTRAATCTVAVVGIVIVGYIAHLGQQVLPDMRGYWPDVTSLTEFLRTHVKEGDTILMEQGSVERYYLIAHGTPGRIPRRIWDTWWYQDEEGQGSDPTIYQRAIAQRRFDVVVFDYTVTADLDSQLLPTLQQNGYDLSATFSARIGASSPIDVFERAASD